VGVRGLSDCGYRGSCSVENDFGTEGTAGALAVRSALRRLFFLVGGIGAGFSSTVSAASSLASSFASTSSGMLSVVAGILFNTSASAAFFFALSSFWAAFFSFLLSFVGEFVAEAWCCAAAQDFLRSFVRDLTGGLPAGSVSFTASLRLRSGLGSTEGSLLLVKGRNLEERRAVTAGLNCFISRTWGASSEDGLEPPEELSDVTSTSLTLCRSSSESCAGASPSRPFTRGKYVYEAALGSCARSTFLSPGAGGAGPTSEAALLRPRDLLENTSWPWPRRAEATAIGMAASTEDVGRGGY
jgi:hypothetical protein